MLHEREARINSGHLGFWLLSAFTVFYEGGWARVNSMQLYDCRKIFSLLLMICTFTMNAKGINHLLIPVCSLTKQNVVEPGGQQLSQENLLLVFPYVLALGDMIY